MSTTSLRLAAVSDINPRPRGGITAVTLSSSEAIAEDTLHIFGQFAVMLRENYAISIDGVTHLLPANRGARS